MHDNFAAASRSPLHQEGNRNHEGARECEEVDNVQVGEKTRLMLHALVDLLQSTKFALGLHQLVKVVVEEDIAANGMPDQHVLMDLFVPGQHGCKDRRAA